MQRNEEEWQKLAVCHGRSDYRIQEFDIGQGVLVRRVIHNSTLVAWVCRTKGLSDEQLEKLYDRLEAPAMPRWWVCSQAKHFENDDIEDVFEECLAQAQAEITRDDCILRKYIY
jgi:GTPase SAR1 family protein